MNEKIKETLEKQIDLLAERSRVCNGIPELTELSRAMAVLINEYKEQDDRPQCTANAPEPIGDFELFWTEERIRKIHVPELEKIRGRKLSAEEIKDTMNRYLMRDLIHYFRGEHYPISEQLIDNVLQAIRGNAR